MAWLIILLTKKIKLPSRRKEVILKAFRCNSKNRLHSLYDHMNLREWKNTIQQKQISIEVVS